MKNIKASNDSLKIASTIEFRDGIRNSSFDRQAEVLRNALLEEAEVYRTFTMDYRACLRIAMDWRGLDQKELARLTDLSEKTIGRILNGDTVPKEKSLALICLAMRLPIHMSLHIFSCSPCSLSCSRWDADNQRYDRDSAYIIGIMSRFAGSSMDEIKKYFDAFDTMDEEEAKSKKSKTLK